MCLGMCLFVNMAVPDVDDIARTLKKVCVHGTVRDDLRERGYKQAQEFSWKKTAMRMMDIYGALSRAS